MKKEHTHSTLLRAACMATIGVIAAANAAAQQDCRSIEDDALRLACYDGQAMPPTPAEVPQPVETVEAPPKVEMTEPQAAPAAATPAAEKAPAAAAPAATEAPAPKPIAKEVPAAAPAPLDDEIGKESLGRDEKDELIVHGTVVRCAKDATKKYLFYFDNGQVWKQKDNTNIRWKECAFDVTITKDFFGYRMTPVGETRRVRIARLK
jgi:pyruvate/2-oxoglutarate dehydrogenase complex dihydrolipoamide acyltransferase (E2) component